MSSGPEDGGGTTRRFSRRTLFKTAGGAGAGAVLLGAAGYGGHRWPWFSPGGPPTAQAPGPTTQAPGPTAQAPGDPPEPTLHQTQFDRFVSMPDLVPPRVTVRRVDRSFGGPAGDRLIFLAPKKGGVQAGVMVLDTSGRLVWFRHTEQEPMDLRPQTYRGEPVLTWWEGKVVNGHGEGHGVIVDSAYRQIATVRAGHGLDADLHEFRLTPQGTALITAYRTTTADLSGLGGRAHTPVYTGVAQEVDVATGKVLFSWDSLDHVPIAETYSEITPDSGTPHKPFDYFHVNSVAVMPDGDLLVSSRHTWTVYKIDRSHGGIVWRLGGRHSDFRVSEDARFAWQHDAVPHGPDRMSLFDNATPSQIKGQESRGLVLDLDTTAMTASLVRAYYHPAHLHANSQGNVQLIPGGAFVGWGDKPYFSQFETGGRMVLDGRFVPHVESYRAFTGHWTGRPPERPALVATSSSSEGGTVFASWNGSTQVRRWRVFAGTAANRMRQVADAWHTGLETAITVHATGPYFAVAAVDARGEELARSATVRAEQR